MCNLAIANNSVPCNRFFSMKYPMLFTQPLWYCPTMSSIWI